VTYSCEPARLLQRAPSGGRPCHRPPASPTMTDHLTKNDRLHWKTDGRPPANGLPPALRQQSRHKLHRQRIHTSPGPAQTPHTLPQPTAATAQSKPRSGPHYGTEFRLLTICHCRRHRSRDPVFFICFLFLLRVFASCLNFGSCKRTYYLGY
jgi:hypothetical protein